MTRPIKDWSPAYEWKAVLLLSLSFGLVGLDRWIIAPLFPSIMRDLDLGYSQIGVIAGALAIGWGVAAILMGPVSDRVGRRRVLIPAILVFSLLAGASGLAGSFATLMLMRGLMGLAEGAFTPASVASTAEASKPSRRGFNQGFQLSLFALLGLGFGPILATQFLGLVPSWRYVFVIVSIPGFVLALLLAIVIREPIEVPSLSDRSAPVAWREVLRCRNVLLALAAILCAMCCVFVIGAMMPSYLVDHLKLTPEQMGFVMAAVGFGGFAGQFGISGLSDFFGRRTMAVVAFAAGVPLLWGFAQVGANPVVLFALLFSIGFCCMGLLALFTGPVAVEAVKPIHIGTAIGLVSGVGEIFGGGIAPVVSGWIAETYGIEHVLDLGVGALIVGALLSCFLRESAPRLIERRERVAAISTIDA